MEVKKESKLWLHVKWHDFDEFTSKSSYLFLVDGAIHEAAGELLREENKKHGKCKVGQAVISGGYKLPAKCKF